MATVVCLEGRNKTHMNINKLIEVANILKELQSEEKPAPPMPTPKNFTPSNPVIQIGAKVEIRTPVFFWCGIVTHYDGQWVTISNVSWIANEGRMTEAMKTGDFDEVEVYPPERLKTIPVSAIVDVSVVPKIPTSQK